MRKSIFTILFLTFYFFGMSSNEYLISELPGTYHTCSGIIYDSGGSAGNYSDNEDYTVTLVSADNQKISLHFIEFDTEAGSDILTVHDGNSELHPVLFRASGTELNNKIVSASGNSITLVWKSNGSLTAKGFAAELYCKSRYELFTVEHLNSIPPLFSEDNTYKYLNAIVGDTVSIGVMGNYPNSWQDNNDLTDSDLNFRWIIRKTGNDNIEYSGTGMNNLVHTFESTGIYNINVTAINQNLSDNLNDLFYKVIVSEEFDFSGVTVQPDIVCLGDTLFLNADINLESLSYSDPRIKYDTVFITDGSGVSYESSILIDNFDENAIIEDISDINSLLINMEHSYLGDLSIILKCPNGQKCLLKAYNSPNPFGLYMSESVEYNDLNVTGSISGGNVHIGWAPDPNATSPCYLAPGEGMDYWFTPSSTNHFGQDGPTQRVTYTDPCGNTESWEQLESGYYGTYQSMRTLVGCPMNGEWTLEIRDNIGSDNGYLFYWGLELAGHQFNDSIVTYNWSGENIIGGANSANLTAVPLTPGIKHYTFTVIKSSGIVSDTTFTVEVLGIDDPACCNIPEFSISIDPDELILTGTEVIFNSTLSNTDPSYVCFWDFGDGQVLTNCENNISHIYSEEGVYIPYLTIYKRNNTLCRQEAFLPQYNIIVSSLTDIIKYEIAGEITIRPNPASDFIYVGFDKSETLKNVSIIDIRGKLLMTIDGFKDGEINISSLKPGMYILKAIVGNKIYTEKFVVE